MASLMPRNFRRSAVQGIAAAVTGRPAALPRSVGRASAPLPAHGSSKPPAPSALPSVPRNCRRLLMARTSLGGDGEREHGVAARLLRVFTDNPQLLGQRHQPGGDRVCPKQTAGGSAVGEPSHQRPYCPLQHSALSLGLVILIGVAVIAGEAREGIRDNKQKRESFVAIARLEAEDRVLHGTLAMIRGLLVVLEVHDRRLGGGLVSLLVVCPLGEVTQFLGVDDGLGRTVHGQRGVTTR